MKTVAIHGTELAYCDVGAGRALLLVHAFPFSSAMWQSQIEVFSPKYRVIAPDLRGFGETPLGDESVSINLYTDDLAALLDHLKLDRLVIGGLSMGGYICFAFLRRHRGRVAGLILADTRAKADTEEGKQGREKNARLVEERGSGALVESMLPKLVSPSATEKVRNEVRLMIESADRHGVAAALRAMAGRPDSTPLLAQIDVPTLIIVGSQDSFTPPNEACAMHEAIPKSRLVELPGAAHLSNLENPEAFNEAVAGFLASNPA